MSIYEFCHAVICFLENIRKFNEWQDWGEKQNEFTKEGIGNNTELIKNNERKLLEVEKNVENHSKELKDSRSGILANIRNIET